MSDIAGVAPAEAQMPVEVHQPPQRAGDKAPRKRPRREARADDDVVDVPPHKLDMEA